MPIETLATATGQPQTNADGVVKPDAVSGEVKPDAVVAAPVDDAAKAEAVKAEAAKADAAKADAAKAEETRRAALTEDQRKAEDKAKAEADEKQKANFGAPDKYEFKPGEGKVEPDASLSEELTGIAKELNLSQVAAQRLYDLGSRVAEKQFERVHEQIEKTKAEWTSLSKADKEFGGDQIDANLGVARKAMEVHGTPELKTLLNDTGLGNHPEIIRWMFRVGKTLQQDQHVNGTGSGKPARSAQSFYDKSNMNP